MIPEGQKLGEYEVLERLGQGGMGAVYKALQTGLRRLVAIKVLQPALASDAEYIARFQNEAVAAASLNHPNLVQVYSAGEADGLRYFAMEYVEGESVQARLKRKGRIKPGEAIAIAMNVASALDYGWRKAQLIHRDIKPDNIFLSGDGEVKLGDLGLAKSVSESQGITLTGISVGTPHYISPEQADGKKDIDLRADIYSLGCTLFHMVSGQPPYSGDSAISVIMKHIRSPVPNLRSLCAECPPMLAAAIGRMMQKPPAARQQDYSEVIADLRRAYEQLNAPVPELHPVRTHVGAGLPATPKKSSHALVWGSVAATVAVVVGVFFAFRDTPAPGEPAKAAPPPVKVQPPAKVGSQSPAVPDELKNAPKIAKASSVPNLVAPASGAVMPNGSLTNKNMESAWDFRWDPVAGASAYELFVKGAIATIPLVNKRIENNRHTETKHGYIAGANLRGWKWKVRAMVGGEWQDWSDEREFSVAQPSP